MSDLFPPGGGVRLCGHRGHSVDGLENGRTALSVAREHGAALCEIDLRLTRDGQFAVFHDTFLDDASTGSGPVRAWSLDELKGMRHRPRGGGAPNDPIEGYADILAHARELDLGLVVELKDQPETDAQRAALTATAREAGMLDRILFSAFDHVFLKDLKAEFPGIRTFGIVHERHVDPLAIARAGSLDVYSVDHPYLDEARAVDLRANGVGVAHFVPRPPVFERAGPQGTAALDRLATALRSGVIDIFGCDDVAWGRAFLNRGQFT